MAEKLPAVSENEIQNTPEALLNSMFSLNLVKNLMSILTKAGPEAARNLFKKR